MKRLDPDEARKRLYAVAHTQSGYFSAAQALEAGYSRRLQHYHAHRGHWTRVDRGIYRLRDYPSTPHEDLVRWALWARGRAVVSHDTAAAVHELGDLLPAKIHMTVERGFRKRIPPVLVVHRAALPEAEIRSHGGFRITTPLRTILDLLRASTESDRLSRVVREALDRGAVRRGALVREIARLSEPDLTRGLRVLAQATDRPRSVRSWR